jgi:DNA-directed RNA polymerase alpha subunit
MDAIYSPIERISYEVESARVGQNGNFDFNQLVILTEALKLTDDKHITKLIYEETEDFIGNNNNN